MTQLEDYNDGYYHLAKDLEEYPDAWCYVVWSRRGPGKTYSALWNSYYNHIPIIYMKRTQDDVELICTDSNDFDLSPYVPINRDKNVNIKGKMLKKGIGGFWDTNSEGEIEGAPMTYAVALNAIKKVKGIDMSRCEWLIFDEFIPQIGEIIRRGEGEMLLEFYMTVARDRLKRGRKPLKLILFANAEDISTPVTNVLEIINDMAKLNASGQSHLYIEDRGIMLHHITDAEVPLLESEKGGIFQGMSHTAWARKAFGGEFTNNDFSNIVKLPMKGMKPLIHIKYKTYDYYVYLKNSDGMYYMTKSKANKCTYEYDLNTENGQKLFYYNHCTDLRYACIDGRMKFELYSMYDLIINYKRFFDV